MTMTRCVAITGVAIMFASVAAVVLFSARRLANEGAGEMVKTSALYDGSDDSWATVIDGDGSIDARALMKRVESADRAKPVIVRPRSGRHLTVLGDLTVEVPNVTVEGVDVRGTVSFKPGSDFG